MGVVDFRSHEEKNTFTGWRGQSVMAPIPKVPRSLRKEMT